MNTIISFSTRQIDLADRVKKLSDLLSIPRGVIYTRAVLELEKKILKNRP